MLRQEATLVTEYLKLVAPNVGVSTKKDINRIRSRINPDARSTAPEEPTKPAPQKTEADTISINLDLSDPIDSTVVANKAKEAAKKIKDMARDAIEGVRQDSSSKN
ncbi:MAG: hypothetical protein AAFQ87_25985 [Bacteroidota bacterium]